MKTDLKDVEVLYQTKTLRAVCVHAEGASEDIWLPLAQCALHPAEPFMRGERVILTASASLLTEKGLI